MKIVFGINNENTVKGIVSFYEEKYKEKIEYKCVFYFKQLIQEIRSGNYDRAVFLEELEKFPTKNLAQIDEYLFSNFDNLTDIFDARNVIIIASERRKHGDEFLNKLFNMGIYSVLTGNERTKGKVSELINKPLVKKDVKKYYEKSYKNNLYEEANVSEIEIQRIISYYNNLNGNADKYNEIFNRISAQYTDKQLKIIINFLPQDVKQYLSFNNEKYKYIMSLNEISIENEVKPQLADETPKIEIKQEPEVIEKIIVKERNTNPGVVTEVLEKEVYKSIYEVPKDYKKVVCFVGAPKTGTTFCINAIATSLARNKIKTAILDMTRKKDSYIIYTYDSEGKRNIAAKSLKYASKGLNEPLAYEKLSVYTSVPGEDRRSYNAGVLVETIMQNNTVVLMDTDFSTPTDYFRLCQEIYIVQDMDVLNISQTTLFLKELKLRGIPLSKVRIIINKHIKCAITARDILDGIAVYTSYDLKTYDELLPSGNIPYFILPFSEENYKKYTEMVYKYTNVFSTFTNDFLTSLNRIINSIYPLGNTNSKNGSYINSRKRKKSNLASLLSFKRPMETYFSVNNNNNNDGFEKEVK